jgi:branched-chain amino acid transport system ATP-binding protein
VRSCQVFKYAYLFSQRALGADDRAAVFEIIAQLNREQQVGILIAEQNANVALRYASQAYVPDTGRVVLSGSAAELLARGDLHDIYLGKQ